MENRFAVIGNPIAHSLSPIIHQRFAEQMGLMLQYEKIHVDDIEFEQTVFDFFHQGGKGLNLTLPFKERAFSMADIHTPRCKQAKAANTLWMDNGLLHADTTDGVGLIRDLSRHVTLKDKSILLLGAGGASRGIIGPLLDANIATLVLANRTESRAKALQRDFPEIKCSALDALTAGYDVIINATSASLTNAAFLLPSSLLTPTTYCYDLVYNVHEPTSFISWARQHGCAASDGLGMLVEQASEAFFIWHAVMPRSTSDVILDLRRV